MEKEQSQVLITGCPRSGAGLIAAAINICGAFGGELTAPAGEIKTFENPVIRDGIEGMYFRSIGYDVKGQNPIPETSSLMIPADWKNKIIDAFGNTKYHSGTWFYKSSRSCLIWPVWNHAFPNAKWVVVRRNSEDIATSCMSTSYMSGYNTKEDWVKLSKRYDERFVEMIRNGLNVKQIWPERIVKGNYEQLYEVIEWLGLPWKSKEVIDYIEPRLWKSRKQIGIKI